MRRTSIRNHEDDTRRRKFRGAKTELAHGLTVVDELVSLPRSICFLGLRNLPLLAPEFETLGSGGAELQQTLLARALVGRGWTVSMAVMDLGQKEGTVWDGIVTDRKSVV